MKLRYPFAAVVLGLITWSLWPDAPSSTEPTVPNNGRDVIILPNPLNNNPASAPTQARSTVSPALVSAARSQIGKTVAYDPAYTVIPYPNGDVPMHKGVCTDAIIRALRTQGLDLQALIHVDMKQNFAVYPKKWGLTAADANIDHRRVPNIQTYFKRQGYELDNAKFEAGDIITWDLGKGLVHIGIASDKLNKQGEPYIIHNIGSGT